MQFEWSHGVLMGNRFWTFGGYEKIMYAFKFLQIVQTTQTTIWSTEKNVWIKGPELYDKLNGVDYNQYGEWQLGYTSSFASVINSTSIILIGGSTVICVNIVTNRWKNYPDFPLLIYTEMVAPTVTFDKNGKRYVYISKKKYMKSH